MRVETLHLTLVFIGGIERARLEPLRQAARKVGAEEFDLCFDRAHYWGRNHIVYAAPDQVPPRLGQLVGALERNLAKEHFKFDEREHKPHITLLRDARCTNAEVQAPQPVRWRIKDFALVESVPQGGMMGYRVLDRFPLKTAEIE